MLTQPLVMCGIGLAVFMAFIFAMRFLRRVSRRYAKLPPPPPFDFVEIQRMLDVGTITAEEHERLREVLLEQRACSFATEIIPVVPVAPRGFEVVPAKGTDRTSGS